MESFTSLFRPSGRRGNKISEGVGAGAPLRKAESRLLKGGRGEHKIDFLFIHDAVLDPDTQWRYRDSDELWPSKLFELFPFARIFIYQYERSWVKSLDDIVDPKHIRKISGELLEFLGSDNNKSSVPLVIFACGFGGLLYEQVFVWSETSDSSHVLRERRHTAFLFGTPHFGAGIAEWAIMVAKIHGIPCAETAQTQDWSSLENKILETADMQRQFREVLSGFDRGAKLTGCFSTLRESASRLTLSSEWAILPEFTPIAVNTSHSSMTTLGLNDVTRIPIVRPPRSVIQKLLQQRPTGLAGDIFDNLVTSAFDRKHRKFLPQGCLDKLLTMEAIKKELDIRSSKLKTENTRVIDFVMRRARRLFATMVCCEVSAPDILLALKSAEAINFDDGRLPVENLRLVPRNNMPDLFRLWDYGQLNTFYRIQWGFLAPIFSVHHFSSQTFNEDHILPFVSVETLTQLDGHHGDERFGIPLSHLGQVERDGMNVAEHVVLKKMDVKEEWQNITKAIESSWGSIPEYVAKPIVSFAIHDKHYIMFDGGLQDYWVLKPWMTSSAQRIAGDLHQVYELLQNLDHTSLYKYSLDLHPGSDTEFILNHLDGSISPTFKGSLEDFLLHYYDQSYQTWSMCCVVLEAVVYTLYGYKEVGKLRRRACEGSLHSPKERLRFEESMCSALEVKGRRNYTLSYLGTTRDGEKIELSALYIWIQHIQSRELECRRTSAIRDVLDLVQNNLYMMREDDLRAMGDIASQLYPVAEKAKTDEQYAFLGQENKRTITSGAWLWDAGALGPSPPYPRQHMVQWGDWQFILENDFAEQAMKRLHGKYSLPLSPITQDLCDTCHTLDFAGPTFHISETVSNLEERSRRCPLCQMLLAACKRIDDWDQTGLCTFERRGSNIYLSNTVFPPVLSLSRNLDLISKYSVQIGFPQLPINGDRTFELIKTWLEYCDKNHSDCQPHTKTSIPRILIDVSQEAIRLDKDPSRGDVKYAALSYRRASPMERLPLGNPIPIEHDHNYADDIQLARLPETFQDAVKTTRGLGIRYLWIDILCTRYVVDYQTTTDEIFSGAYCVLVASRASSQFTGFLGQRSERSFITIPDKSSTKGQLYLCAPIDDFNRDVMQSNLHSTARGFQQRALATRSIFFGEKQLYLECGRGIRCETLSLIHNQTASFLGDPAFPSKALEAPLVDRIMLFQSLYVHLSRLYLQSAYDRPLGTAGIERRLAGVLQCPSRNGIFEGGLIHYSLLWCRHKEESRLKGLNESRLEESKSWFEDLDSRFHELEDCWGQVSTENQLGESESQFRVFKQSWHHLLGESRLQGLEEDLLQKLESPLRELKSWFEGLEESRLQRLQVNYLGKLKSRFGELEKSWWLALQESPLWGSKSQPNLPSWSWQARVGRIDYIAPDFGTVEWDSSIRILDDQQSGFPKLEINAYALRFHPPQRSYPPWEGDKQSIVYDDPYDVKGDIGAMCVILGRFNQQTRYHGIMYVVLIVRCTGPLETCPYKRIGAGILDGGFVEQRGDYPRDPLVVT